jgi:hypothetical protein
VREYAAELFLMPIDERYACVHSSCLTAPSSKPTYYETWTSLLRGIRTDHPPTCSQDEEADGDTDEGEPRPKKRTRGGEMGHLRLTVVGRISNRFVPLPLSHLVLH